MPVNYQEAKIYKIIDMTSDDIYIGSTCEPTLARRLAGHVRNYKTYLKGKCNFVTSFKIIQKGNYDIQLIEAFPCNSKDELHSREGYHIKNNDCINKVIAGRTIKEYKKEYQNSKDFNHKPSIR